MIPASDAEVFERGLLGAGDDALGGPLVGMDAVTVADLAAVVVSGSGRRYRGACIDTGGGTGSCAEHAAAAARPPARRRA